MKLFDIYEKINAFAPKALSDEYCAKYDAYDNSGILLETGADIKGAVFSLDFSLAAIDDAIATGANLLVTHHPAIYGKIGDIRVSDFDPLGRKLVKCLQNGISVISMHLNLDCTIGGVDESLAKALGAKGEAKLMHPLSVGGYGRAYEIEETPLGGLVEKAKAELNAKRILVYGNEQKSLTKLASFCGGGADEAAVRFAKESGAEAMVSSDFKHHIVALAKESGLAVIALTHYASEQYGFEKFYQKIRRGIEVPCTLYADETLL